MSRSWGGGMYINKRHACLGSDKRVFSLLRFNLDLVFYFLILLDVSARTAHSGHLAAQAPLTRGLCLSAFA